MVRIITSVITEPLTLLDVRQHLRLPDDPARPTCCWPNPDGSHLLREPHRRALAEQTLEMYCDRFPGSGPIVLPCPPLVSVVEIGYTDSSGLETILPAADIW
jgi:hypothetical protein